MRPLACALLVLLLALLCAPARGDPTPSALLGEWALNASASDAVPLLALSRISIAMDAANRTTVRRNYTADDVMIPLAHTCSDDPRVETGTAIASRVFPHNVFAGLQYNVSKEAVCLESWPAKGPGGLGASARVCVCVCVCGWGNLRPVQCVPQCLCCLSCACVGGSDAVLPTCGPEHAWAGVCG